MAASNLQEPAGSLFSARPYTPQGVTFGEGRAGGARRRFGLPLRSLKIRGGWVWIPLSFIFLLVGTVLGFQVALSVRSQITSGPKEDPYALNLTATPSAGSVHLRWDRNAVPVRQARKGVLAIADNGSRKSVDLDAGHLRHGSVIYRRLSDEVHFRLEVFVNDQSSVAETIDFSLAAAGKPPAGKP